MSNETQSPSSAPARTALYASHLAAGARMVDFSGWDMPVNYGSQIDEHHAVRRDAGMFDVSHMCALDLHGAQAQQALRRLLANDVAKLTVPGKALYSCMLDESGGVIDDLIVHFFTPQHYRLVVNAGTVDKDVAWMRAQLAAFDAQLTVRRDLAIIAVQGPQARARCLRAFPSIRAAAELPPFASLDCQVDGQLWWIARTGYTGEDGFEIALPNEAAAAAWQALLDAGVAPCGLGARDTLRLEAGMNLYGQDMDEAVSPYEAGLRWTVDLNDAARDFIGKSALAGRSVSRQFVGLRLLERGVLRAHQTVVTVAGDGEITSGSFSPSMNASIALARIPLGIAVGDEVLVEIRDKQLKAKVVAPRFVRNGQILD